MKETKDSIVIYKSFFEAINDLSKDEKLEIFNAFYAFMCGKPISFSSPVANMAWRFISRQIENDSEKWSETKSKRSIAGSKGGKKSAVIKKLNSEKHAENPKKTNLQQSENQDNPTIIQANSSKNFSRENENAIQAKMILLESENSNQAIQANQAVDVDVNVDVDVDKKNIQKENLSDESDEDSQDMPPEGSVRWCALQIYSAYPRKVGRGAALKAIEKALTQISFEELSQKVAQYAAAVEQWPEEQKRFIPHPATWFNQERYFDDSNEWQYPNPKERASGNSEKNTPPETFNPENYEGVRY